MEASTYLPLCITNRHVREQLSEEALEYITWSMKESYEANSLQLLLPL